MCVKLILINALIIKQLLEEGSINNAYKEKDSYNADIFLYLLEINGENHIGVLYSYFMKNTKIYEIGWYEC